MILNTFYLLFKSNTEDVEKGAKRAKKATDELNDSVKKSGEESERLGKNFVKIVEAGAQAATAVVSFGAIKSGILNTAKFNSDLEVQSKLLGQNADQMLAYGAAVERAGGSMQGLLAYADSASRKAAEAGMPFNLDRFMRQANQQMQGLSKNEQLRRLGMLGINDPGMISMLTQSTEEFEKAYKAASEYAKASEASRKASREWEAQTSEFHQTMQAFWSNINSVVLPGLTAVAKGFNGIFSVLKDNQVATAGFFLTWVTLAGFFATTSIKTIAGLVGIGGAAGTALTGLSRFAFVASKLLGTLTAIAAIGWEDFKAIRAIFDPSRTQDSWIARNSSDFGKWIDRKLHPSYYKDLDRKKRMNQTGPMVGTGNGGDADAMAFWMAQGYTKEQAAGIVANEMHESGGNPMARGDGGNAHGLFQWHADRRAKILAATGIDVSTASAADQRRAAAWEMQNEGIFSDSAFRRTRNAGEAAAYFSSKFERPANGGVEALKRAQTAMDIVNGTPMGAVSSSSMNSRSTSIRIDKVEVNTQATDAQGIAAGIGDELQNQFHTTIGNYDDGVAY